MHIRDNYKGYFFFNLWKQVNRIKLFQNSTSHFMWNTCSVRFKVSITQEDGVWTFLRMSGFVPTQ